MSNDKHSKEEKKQHDQPVNQPDPETLHKTDPQENMQGPISSLLNKTREKLEKKGGESPDDNDKK